MDLSIYLRGLVIGFSIAAPVGPIGVLCIRRTLAEGRLVGFLSGTGAATADAFYGGVAAFGLAALSGVLLQQQTALRLVGGLFLLYLGARTLFSKPAAQAANAILNPAGLLAAYFSTLLLTLTNPLTILSFLAIFSSLGASSAAAGGSASAPAATVVLGVFSGSLLWWFLLSLLAGFFHAHLEGPRLVWVNRFSGLIILGFAVSILGTLFFAQAAPWASLSPAAGSQAGDASAGFNRAAKGRGLVFPADFGAHPEFQTEWWYFTGNLRTQDGRRFGFQLTFFRRALQPPQAQVPRSSGWAADQVYMAHFALTDAAGKQHIAAERLERGAAGLAGVTAAPFEAWLDDWQVTQTAPGQYRLQAVLPAGEGKPANAAPVQIDLEMLDRKGPVLQGDQGYSQKGADPGNASYYYSLTHLETHGSIGLDQQNFEVQGLAWMDHEFSTSALAAYQVGWDWFSIQLDNNQELMLFQLRNADGSLDPFSSAAIIGPDGKTRLFARGEFTISVLSSWRSPLTQANYPASWQVEIPQAGVSLRITPVLADQELDLRYKYWEGAVDVSGTFAAQPVAGAGYVELTGYAGSMAGEF